MLDPSAELDKIHWKESDWKEQYWIQDCMTAKKPITERLGCFERPDPKRHRNAIDLENSCAVEVRPEKRERKRTLLCYADTFVYIRVNSYSTTGVTNQHNTVILS